MLSNVVTFEQLQNILFIAIGIMALILIVSNIPWRKIAERWVGDDPEKAAIYIDKGTGYDLVIGKRSHTTKEGQQYDYRIGKLKSLVNVGKDYPYKYIHGRRMIFVKDGEPDCKPIDGAGSGFPNGLDDTRNLVWSRLVNDAMKTVKGKEVFKWLYVGIALVIGAGAYYVITTYAMPAMGYGNANSGNVTIEKPISSNPITVK